MFDTEIDHLNDVAALLSMANNLALQNPELSRLLMGAQETLGKAICGLEQHAEAMLEELLQPLSQDGSPRRLH